MVREILHTDTIWKQMPRLSLLLVLCPLPLGESPVLGHKNLLSSWELELGSPQCLNEMFFVGILGSHRHEGFSNPHTSNCALWFTECSTHPCLKPISSSTRQHLVDSEHMERVFSHSQVESFSSTELHQVLVGTDTSSLHGLGGQLFPFIGAQMHAEWKFVYSSLLLAQVEDSDFGIWYTPAKPGLWIRLVLAIAITPCWSATHLEAEG